MTITPKNTLQTSLHELQNKIDVLKGKKRTLTILKTELEKNIDLLYDQPLNDRQMMQMVCAVVDVRAKNYMDEMMSSGFFESQKTLSGRPLSFDDFEQIQGRGRVQGIRSSPKENDLIYKVQFAKTFDACTHTWMSYFFGDLIKQKVIGIYKCKHRDSMLEELESIEDRSKAINDLHSQVKKSEKEIETIKDDIETASKPVMEFMRTV